MTWKIFRTYHTYHMYQLWVRDCGCVAEENLDNHIIMLYPCDEHENADPQELFGRHKNNGDAEGISGPMSWYPWWFDEGSA